MARKKPKQAATTPVTRKRAAREKTHEQVYEAVYRRLMAVMDKAPQGPGVELAVLDAVIAASAHYAADCFNEQDAAAGALKCVQLFAERMRESLVTVYGEDDEDTVPAMTLLP
jgi:hypothetical protein